MTPIDDGRSGCRRSPTRHQRRPDRPAGPRHAEQLRHGIHPLGHLSGLRRKFQRLLSQEQHADDVSKTATASTPPASATCGITTDKRFRVDEEPNEPNRFGWVTEIDPFDRSSMPVKRTALGRFKHEGAWVQEAAIGLIVVYMGDDERNEYIYRYVSNLPGAARAAEGDRSARRRHPLRRQIPQRRRRRMAAADTEQPSLLRLDFKRHSDQYPRRGRCRQGNDDGSPGMDRYIPGSTHRHRHIDQQQPARQQPAID